MSFNLRSKMQNLSIVKILYVKLTTKKLLILFQYRAPATFRKEN